MRGAWLLTYALVIVACAKYPSFVTSYLTSPLNCSTSSVSSCQAYLFLANNTTPIKQTARLYNIPTANVTAFNATKHDYVASVNCSCHDMFNKSAFFHLVTYIWQDDDVGKAATTVCNSRFHGLCWTRGDYGINTSKGDAVTFALGCGCPIAGYKNIITYHIQESDMVSVLAYNVFHTSEKAIVQLNNLADPNLIIADQVLFIPTNQSPPTATLTSSVPSPPSNLSAPPRTTGPATRQPPSSSLSVDRNMQGRNNPNAVLKYALPGVAVLALVLIAFSMILHRRMKIVSMHKSSHHHAHHHELVCETCISEHGIAGDLRIFSLKELQISTDYFSDSCKLGYGAFGQVYKGILSDGTAVAIKTRKVADTFSKKQFVNEINLLSKLHHPSLVELLGVCLEGGAVILVYQYVPNGNLAQHLAGMFLPAVTLNWNTRLTISIEIAEALYYIHNAFLQSAENVPGPVYHRDIKPSNILLDENLSPKLADFGLSRLVIEDSSNVFTNVVGTMGYGDPQYFQFEHLSDKSDVFSFGVILMELITAKKHIDIERGSEEIHLGAYSLSMKKQGRFEEIIDPQLKADELSWGNPDIRRAIWSCANMAWRCMKFERAQRPSMGKVVEELKKIKKKLDRSSTVVPSTEVSSKTLDMDTESSESEVDSLL